MIVLEFFVPLFGQLGEFSCCIYVLMALLLTNSPQPERTSMTANDTTSVISTLADTFDLLKQIGHPVEVSPFSQALSKLKNPTYRIAFVGRFQVGKSTLINRAFIKDAALLSSGEGLPTTAVATELKYGETSRLEVFNWNTSGNELLSADQLEVRAKVIDQPSAEDLARETANDDPATRTELSRRLARVVLEWPSESLRRYTLLDTPGIDDPDEVLLTNTTYRLLPECDLAVLLVPAAQLSKVETDFLRQKLFDQGFTRLLVLVSHHADTQPRSAEVLARILTTIRGQLDAIGRGQVPVQAFCYDESATGELLKTPDQIEAAVISFANEQAGAARLEKAANLACKELHLAAGKLQAEIAANGKSVEERAQMLTNARKDIEAMNRRHDQIADSLNLRLRAARDTYLSDISKGLRQVNEDFASGFKTDGLSGGDAYDAAAAHIRGAEIYLQPKVGHVFSLARESFQSSLRTSIDRFSADIRLAQDDDESTTVQLAEKGFLHRSLLQLPGYVVTIGDYVITNGPIPGGVIISAGLRLLLGKMFEKSKIMPADLLRRWMVENAKQEISAALTTLQNQANSMIMGNMQQVEAQIKNGFSEFMEAELLPLEQALKQPPVNLNTQQVQEWLTQVGQLEQQLSTKV